MAEAVFTNAYLMINAVDLSDHVRNVRLSYSGEAVDVSAMGDTTRLKLAGLKDWGAEVEFNQDYAAAKVDATLFGIVGTVVALKLRPDTGAIAATNPEYQGNVVVTEYTPMGGSHGAEHTASCSLAGSDTLTRDVLP